MMNGLDSLIGNDTINLLCRAIMIVAVILNWRSMNDSNSKKGTGFLFAWFVLTIYSVFYSPTTGDNYSSLETYLAWSAGRPEEWLHFEPVYFMIMRIAPFGYVGYRLCVWGVGMALIIFLVKKCKLNPHVTTIFLIGFASFLLYYQRAIIGYALLYWSLFYIISAIEGNGFRDKKNIVISFVLLLLALPFHTTMIIYEIIVIGSLFIPRNKYVFLSILLIGVAIPAIYPSLSDFILSYAPEETQETAMNYALNGDTAGTSNFFGFIASLISRGPYYFILGYSLWNIKEEKFRFSTLEQVLLINAFFLLIISVFYSNQFGAVSGKFFKASMLPFSIFMSSFYTRSEDIKTKKLFTNLLLFSIFGSLLISFLVSLVH